MASAEFVVPSAKDLVVENKECIKTKVQANVMKVIEELRKNAKLGDYRVEIPREAFLEASLYGPIFQSNGYQVKIQRYASVLTGVCDDVLVQVTLPVTHQSLA